MKFRIFILLTLLTGLSISAQSINYQFYDTLRYTDGSFVSPNTVLNDISDDGVMVGYFEDDDGYNAGLLVLPNGKMSSFEFFGYNNTEITGVNENGYVLGKAYTTTNAVVIFQASIVGDIIDQAVELNWNGLGASSKNAGKLNDDNVASGTVRISTQNWLHFESIVSPFSVDNSERYSTSNPTFTTYNTYGLGHNNFEKYTGWYQDGVNRIPYVYDGISDAFFPQSHFPSGATQLRTYLNDINDAGYMAVSYVNSNVKFQGTLGYYDGASTTFDGNFPFASTEDFQLFGINNNNDLVGYYENSNAEKIAIYILVDGPELDDFELNDDAMLISNDSATFEYPVGLFDYENMDEYLGIPDSFYAKRIEDISFVWSISEKTSIQTGVRNISWPAFVFVREEERAYITQNDGTKIPRKEAIIKWVEESDSLFQGYCYGLALFALQNLSDPAILLNRFPNMYTPETNFVNYDASTFDFREMIATLQLQQISNDLFYPFVMQDALNGAYAAQDLSSMEELMRPLVNEIVQGIKNGDPDSSYVLSFKSVWPSKFYHSVMPFKVTRAINFGVPSDTIHCLDSNYPGNVLKVYVDYGSGQSKAYVGTQLVYQLAFVYNSGYLGEILPRYSAEFNEVSNNSNPKSLGPDATYIDVQNLCDFSIMNMDNPSESIEVDAGVYATIWSNVGTYAKMDQDDKIDKLIGQGALNVETEITACDDRNYLSYSYENGLMIYQRNDVQTGELDIVRNMENVMHVVNPDSDIRDLNLVAIHTGVNQETMVAIKDYDLSSNEEVELETIDATHFLLSNDENDDKTYDLIVDYVDGDHLIEFEFSSIDIDLQTNHMIVIQPAEEEAQVIILVDENQDGSIQDTIFGSNENTTSVLDDIFLDEFEVYPNPAEDVLNFKISYQKQVMLSYSLENIFGQVMTAEKILSIHQNNFKIDVKDYTPGLYFLNIKNEHGQTIGKRKVAIK